MVNNKNSNRLVPQSVLNPSSKWLKRHPTKYHKSLGQLSSCQPVVRLAQLKGIDKLDECDADDSDDSSSDASHVSDNVGREDDIDDYDFEALEDIWLKAGEIEPSEATFADDSYGGMATNRRGSVSSVGEARARRCGLCRYCRLLGLLVALDRMINVWRVR